jgi:hypothetical protein
VSLGPVAGYVVRYGVDILFFDISTYISTSTVLILYLLFIITLGYIVIVTL